MVVAEQFGLFEVELGLLLLELVLLLTEVLHGEAGHDVVCGRNQARNDQTGGDEAGGDSPAACAPRHGIGRAYHAAVIDALHEEVHILIRDGAQPRRFGARPDRRRRFGQISYTHKTIYESC